MQQPQRIATGPAILGHVIQIEDRLTAIEARLAAIEAQARARHQVADARYERTDRYIVSDAFEVQGTLVQLHEVIDAWRRTLQEELSATRKALALHLESEGLAHERNGRG
jgi:stress-induced morphogen